MRIVGGLDVHRRQITFDYVDEVSGQSRRGRIAPADRLLLRRWLETNLEGAPAAFAVEACTGWRFVVEELQRAGVEAHLAEPADTAAARGRNGARRPRPGWPPTRCVTTPPGIGTSPRPCSPTPT